MSSLKAFSFLVLTSASAAAFADFTYNEHRVDIALNGTRLDVALDGTRIVVQSGVTLSNTPHFVGFGSFTGGAYQNHDILSWSFNSTPVPEPVTLAALGLGLAAVARRRARKGP